MANATSIVNSAFTADYDSNVRRWRAVNTSQTFYPGSMVGLNTSGLAGKLDDAEAFGFIGIMEGHSKEIVSGESAEKQKINVKRPLLFSMLIASAADGDEGKKVYARFDNEVRYTVGSFSNYVGKVLAVLDSTHVLVTPPWSPIFPGSLSGTFTAAATGTTTLTKFQANKLIVCAATANKSIVLPACALLSPGDEIVFAHTGSANSIVTLDGNASETINGATTYAMSGTQYDMVTLVTDGSNWFVKEGTGVGYFAGSGGTVTQITSITTGVTLNKAAGQITTVAASTAAGAEDTFTVTDALVATTDMVVLSTTYAGAGTPLVYCKKVAAGSFDITISNLHASAALDALLVINFAVVKGATS